jgi:hypothetical protein
MMWGGVGTSGACSPEVLKPGKPKEIEFCEDPPISLGHDDGPAIYGAVFTEGF